MMPFQILHTPEEYLSELLIDDKQCTDVLGCGTLQRDGDESILHWQHITAASKINNRKANVQTTNNLASLAGT